MVSRRAFLTLLATTSTTGCTRLTIENDRQNSLPTFSACEKQAPWPTFQGGPQRLGRSSITIGSSLRSHLVTAESFPAGRVGMMVCTDKSTVVTWRQSKTVFRYYSSTGTVDSFKLDDPTRVYPALHCSNLVVSADSVRYQIDADDWQVRQEQSTASPYTSPLFDTDRLYVTGSGGLQAIDIDTELLWTRSNDRLVTGIASTENTVYAIESNARGGQLIALDAATGDVRWTTDRIGETYTDPVVSRYVYVTNAAGQIFALDQNDGNVVWSHQTGTRDSRFTVPAVGDGVLFVSDEGPGSVRAIRESNGETLWETVIYRNESRKKQTGTLFAPILTEGYVLVSAGPAGLVGLDREDGQKRYQNASKTVVSPLAVSHETIYAATPSGLMLFEPSD